MDHDINKSKALVQSPILTSEHDIAAQLKKNFALFLHASTPNTQKAILRALKSLSLFLFTSKTYPFPSNRK